MDKSNTKTPYKCSVLPTAELNAEIKLPSSKSISNRALIINALAGSKEIPENVSDCDDTFVMIRALKEMGDTIDIMAAGTSMRFLTAFLSITEGVRTITGTERMKNRPIGILVDALRSMGANIEYAEKEGFPPLRITGCNNLKGKCTIAGDVSSQYISAILMIGPALNDGLELTITGNINSRPYIDLTLKIMRDFGAVAEWSGSNTIKVEPVKYKPTRYFVESDWSASSYWYEMLALSDGGTVRLPLLFEDSYQGDSKVADIFRNLGVETTFADKQVILTKKGEPVKHLEYDFAQQPDLVQTFAVTCCMMGITFHFKGTQSLKIKETDRIEALKTELHKMGFVLNDSDNGAELFWDGERCDADEVAEISTYEDHRMAMAFAPAVIKGVKMQILKPMVVTKSYPNYWNDLKKAGFGIENEYN